MWTGGTGTAVVDAMFQAPPALCHGEAMVAVASSPGSDPGCNLLRHGRLRAKTRAPPSDARDAIANAART